MNAARLIFALVCTATMTFLASYSGAITLGDMIISLALCVPTLLVIYSLAENPGQFIGALVAWAQFLFQAAVGLFLITLSIIIMIFSVIFRMGLKLVIGIVYLIFPIDLIPDFLIGLGQLDDLLVFFVLFVWALTSGIRTEGINMIRLNLPNTSFPKGTRLWRNLLGF